LRIERSVDLGFVVEVNEHVETVRLRFLGKQSVLRHAVGATLRRPYLYELELDLAFLNKVVLFT